MRKTKIICTIGPASQSEEVLEQMCHAGMNVARLNFSHGTHPEHLEKIRAIRNVRERLNLPIAIMLDTKGPEYRIKTFENHRVTVETGDEFIFTTDEVQGDCTRVSVTHKELPGDVAPRRPHSGQQRPRGVRGPALRGDERHLSRRDRRRPVRP